MPFNMVSNCFKILVVIACSAFTPFPCPADEAQTVAGRITDEHGNPVEGVTVAEYWQTVESGERLGKGLTATGLTPVGKSFAVSDEDGLFSFESQLSSLGILAVDADGQRGAIALQHVLGDSGSNEIPLRNLTQVTCRFPKMFQSKAIDRIILGVYLLPVESRPLADARLLYYPVESEECSFKLPPGNYRLEATAITVGDPMVELSLAQDEHFEIEEQNHLPLGELQLPEWTDPVVAYARKIADLRKRRSSNQAKSKDDLYGLISPGWKSIDGHGLDHEANIEALRGKWVLLDFWGVHCLPCLKEGIPKLIEFYERNKRHKHRFEIVALYLDFTGRIDSVAGLQKELEPIEKYVWNGKKIPFPIVVRIGVLPMSAVYPFTLGANIGTCVTALLAATAISGAGAQPSLQIALVHLVFNVMGVMINFGIPLLRPLPIQCAEFLARLAEQRLSLAFVYILVLFFVMPLSVVGLSWLF